MKTLNLITIALILLTIMACKKTNDVTPVNNSNPPVVVLYSISGVWQDLYTFTHSAKTIPAEYYNFKKDGTFTYNGKANLFAKDTFDSGTYVFDQKYLTLNLNQWIIGLNSQIRVDSIVIRDSSNISMFGLSGYGSSHLQIIGSFVRIQ